MTVDARHSCGHTQGFEIDHVEERDGMRHIVLTHDHGLRISDGATEELYFPLRKFEGAGSFAIPLATALSQAQ